MSLSHRVSLVRSFSTQHASSFLDPRLVFTFVASRCLNAVFSTAAVSLDLSLCVAFLRVCSPILLLVPIRAHVYGYVRVFLRLQVSNVSSTFRFFVLSSVLCCSALAILFYPVFYLLEVFVIGIRDYLEILYNLYAFLRSSRFFKSLLRNLIIIKLVGKFRLLLLFSKFIEKVEIEGTFKIFEEFLRIDNLLIFISKRVFFLNCFICVVLVRTFLHHKND